MKKISKIMISLLAATMLLASCGQAGETKQTSAPSASEQAKGDKVESKETKATEAKETLYRGAAEVPSYEAKTLDGKTLTNADFKGKTVLLSFGMTYCPDCRREFPIIHKLYEKYGKNEKDVLILENILVDNKKQTPEQAAEYFKEQKLNLPYLLADSKLIKKNFGIKRIPTVMVIGKDGKAIQFGEQDGKPNYYFIEGMDEAQVVAAIDKDQQK